MPVGATIGAATLGGAASIGSGILQSNAANNASKLAAQAQQNTLDFTKGVYNDTRTSLAPTIAQGQGAGTALAGLLGLNGDSAAGTAFNKYLGSTNYNFLLNQGENAVKTANAPALVSGATGKALNDYAQGMAGNALQGYEGLLAGQQGLGVQAALGQGGVGTGASQVINSANQAGAGLQGAAGLVGANAQSNALANLTKAINQGVTGSSFAQPGGGGSGTTMTLANAPASVQSAFEGVI
jgi:hypothetical protein